MVQRGDYFTHKPKYSWQGSVAIGFCILLTFIIGSIFCIIFKYDIPLSAVISLAAPL
ncbi:MAG: hypothetical protein E6713_13910 [Sporomusaceae bacterium]|nr:hypothetical protein [Sporomusaceae bacterium]